MSYKTFNSFKKFKGLLWKKICISLQLIRHLVHKIYIDHTITNFIKTTELKNKGKKFTELIYRKGNISQTLSPIVHLTITIQKMIVFIISIIYMCVWAHTCTQRVNFDKSTTKLHYFCTFSILKKFKYDKKSIVMLSIIYLNSSFCSLNNA